MSNLLDSILEDCRFSPFPNQQADDSPYYLEPGEVDRAVEPQFALTVSNLDEVRSRLSLIDAHMEFVVSARSSRLKRYKLLGQWALADVPLNWSPASRDMDEMQAGGGLEFILAIRIVADAPILAQHGLGVGKVLCRREFAVRQRIDAVSFPFSWRQFGADTNYPSELLWAIRWEDATGEESYLRPIGEVLTVYMNKTAEERLNAMNAAAGKGDLTWRMLAAEIITLIWSEVLRDPESEPDPTDTDTLAGQVYHRLASISGHAYGDIRGMVEDDPGLLELRSHIARIVGVVR